LLLMSQKTKSRSLFPATLRTWLDEQIERGAAGRDDINHYIMSTYLWPLKMYLLNTSWRGQVEADDVIDGFFASRLDRADFFANWRASGKRLRHWLINGLHLHLKERWRDRTSALVDKRLVAAKIMDHSLVARDPVKNIDRWMAHAFVAQALSLARDSASQAGLEAHFDMFLRHHLHDESIFRLAQEHGVSEARAAVMVRTARRHFRRAVEEVLLRDGAPVERHEDEIAELLEAFQA
jgi:hypothetical protein